jgi:hypothetical protein
MNDIFKRYGAFAIALLMGMTPLIWFTPGQVMYSVDLKFPPDLEHWWQYFYMWNETVATGAESILDPCLIFFQGIPAYFRWLGFPVWQAQMYSFTFWFLISSLSMYFLARKIFPTANPLGAPLVCVSAYIYNLWQEHIWIGSKPPLIAAYAVLPWLLKLLLDGLEKEETRNKGFLLVQIAVASFILSSIGNNISEAYVVAFILVLFSVYALGDSWKKGRLKPTALFLFQAATLFVIVNAYWMIPQVTEALHVAGKYDPSQGNLMGWLEGTSRYTSFSNVIRFQGNWTWFEGVGEPYNPYALLYLENWFFILISWILPLLVVFGIYHGRFRFKGFFVLLTVIAIWFGMGVHEPLGFIYEWMFKNIPYFWIVRSPYYKFMLMACIGYAVFLGAFTAHLENRYKNNFRKWIKATAGIFLFTIVYGNIIVSGRMFTPKEERTHLPPNRVAIPEYVSEAGAWLNSQPDKSRVFAFNEDRFWTTNWGFRSLAPSLIYYTTQPVIFRYVPQFVQITTGSPNQTLRMGKIIQKGIRAGRLPRADRLLSLMNTHWVLLDQSLEFVQGGSYESMTKYLREQPGLHLDRRFGNYDFYSSDTIFPFAYTTPKATLIKQPGLDLKPQGSSSMYPDFVGTAEESLIPISQGDWSLDSALILVDQLENQDMEQWIQEENIESVVSYNPLKKVSLENDIFSKESIKKQFTFNTKYMESAGIKKSGIASGAKGEKPITVKLLEGFYPKEEGGEQDWIWMSQSNPKARHISLFNPYKKPVQTNFSFTTTTYGSERSLYFYLNGELIKVMPLKANEKKDVIIRDLVIPPGASEVSFYTPYPAEKMEGKNVSFGFISSSFQFSDLLFKGEMSVAKRTAMEVRIIPMVSDQKAWQEDTGFNPRLRVNGKRIELNRVIDDEIFSLRGSVAMLPGQNRFELVQSKGVDVAILFKPEGLQPLTRQDPKPQVQKIDPTHYKISASISKPGFLIVSESYHPGWELHSVKTPGSDKAFRHFKANGFANGFFLPEKGDYELELVFEPQGLLDAGFVVSILSLIGFCVAYNYKRFQRKPSPMTPASD